MNVTFQELQEMKNSHIEIEYKGETMKFQIKDISKEFWQFLQKVGTINIIADGKR